jgi:hypothetical protein
MKARVINIFYLVLQDMFIILLFTMQKGKDIGNNLFFTYFFIIFAFSTNFYLVFLHPIFLTVKIARNYKKATMDTHYCLLLLWSIINIGLSVYLLLKIIPFESSFFELN